jgi:hypothetical protein
MADFLKHLTPRRGSEAIPNTSDVDQILAAIIADDEGVEAVWPRATGRRKAGAKCPWMEWSVILVSRN